MRTDGPDGFVLVFILWITFLAGFANQFPSPKRRYGLCAAGLGFAIGGISLLMVGMGISSGQYSALWFVVPTIVIPFMVIFFLAPGSGGKPGSTITGGVELGSGAAGRRGRGSESPPSPLMHGW